MSNGYAMLFDSSRCTACRGCQIVCKTWNLMPSPLVQEEMPFTGTYQGPEDINEDTRLIMTFNEERGGEKGVNWAFGRRSCYHCLEAPCESVCPSGCLYIHETGFVGVDDTKCIGCRHCHAACPFDVPHFYGTDEPHSKLNKCDMCISRLEHDLTPACVKVCEPGALKYGTRDEMLAIAHERLDYLKKKGYENAEIYGEDIVGGLRVIHVAKHGAEAHGLDPNVDISLLVPLINLSKPLAAVAAGVTTLGIGTMFARSIGYSRKDIVYNEKTKDTLDLESGEVVKHGDGQSPYTPQEILHGKSEHVVQEKEEQPVKGGNNE